MGPTTRYYENRHSPIRKSLNYQSPPRKDGFQYKETPGQTSVDMPLKNNNKIYDSFVSQTQQKQQFPTPLPTSAQEQQRQLLLHKFRQMLNTRGVRGFVSLKRQFKLIDSTNSDLLTLNEFLQAFDDLKITNLQSGELAMVFQIYDVKQVGKILYEQFLIDLLTPLQPSRLALVKDAFKHIDTNNDGLLSLDEIKAKFDPTRHPDVLSKKKSLDEARFDFLNLFTTLHSANNNFKDQRAVSESDFVDYHTYLNTQIERECDFKKLVVGVWNMDVICDEKQKVQSMTHFIDH